MHFLKIQHIITTNNVAIFQIYKLFLNKLSGFIVFDSENLLQEHAVIIFSCDKIWEIFIILQNHTIILQNYTLRFSKFKIPFHPYTSKVKTAKQKTAKKHLDNEKQRKEIISKLRSNWENSAK